MIIHVSNINIRHALKIKVDFFELNFHRSSFFKTDEDKCENASKMIDVHMINNKAFIWNADGKTVCNPTLTR